MPNSHYTRYNATFHDISVLNATMLDNIISLCFKAQETTKAAFALRDNI